MTFLPSPGSRTPPSTDPGLETPLALASESKAHKILKAQLLALGQAGERRPLCVSSIEFARNQHNFTGDFLENLPRQMLGKKQWALEFPCFIFLCLSLAKVRPSVLAS